MKGLINWQGEAATTAAGEEVWAAIQQVMEEGTAPAPDEAVYAAGALCSLLQGRARHTCSAILNRLTSAVSSARCSTLLTLLAWSVSLCRRMCVSSPKCTPPELLARSLFQSSDDAVSACKCHSAVKCTTFFLREPWLPSLGAWFD